MKIEAEIREIEIERLERQQLVLTEEARRATELSYAPYSKFRVGAAVLLENGEIVRGANQENVSYPVGICAERTAIATAQNIYPNVPIVAIAIAAKTENGDFTQEYVTPCGMCRQTMAELERRYNRSLCVLMCSAEKVAIAQSVKDILPLAF